MSSASKIAVARAGLAIAWVAFCACGGGPQLPPQGGDFPTPVDASLPVEAKPSVECTPARASEDLSARADLTALGTLPGETHKVTITVEELYSLFNSNCGSCHGKSQSNGGRQLADVMAMMTGFDASWLTPVKSDDPAKYMPPAPGGKPYSTRDAKDPVVQFVTYAEAWIAQGRSPQGFTVEVAESARGNYGFTPDMAKAMTNLGTCVPSAASIGLAGVEMMTSMDAFFEGATELPSSLAATDLTTFDSAELASMGVVAYVPTYPLWSGGSGKLRHIRVPRGKAVVVDKATQTFAIPPNTRFYKTFFRKVVDKTGVLRNRKIETRLIVARADEIAADGTATPRALFGTYRWSEDESSATLVSIPYRDGTGFADQTFAYQANEQRYEEIRNALPPGTNVDMRLQAAVAAEPGVQMHYSIPGSTRCIQCHEGSVNKDFVLGFIPLQIRRRENLTGGTYEPTGDDELNQLQRLIDYGVIKGITSPSDITLLEASQGARAARNDAELKAQAYMLGNCAHCHNPRGLPSVTKPALADLLNFMPDSHGGGVFQFPLDRYSPIRQRGANGNVRMPYITPSLYDYPVAKDYSGNRADNGQLFVAVGDGLVTWVPKYLWNGNTCKLDTPYTRAYCTSPDADGYILAPWRSLIYRNVDTPFSYIDDFVPFPHMPMNTVGYDCRAPRVLGEWMVSIPARRPKSDLAESLPIVPAAKLAPVDDSEQPYVEIQPGDDLYSFATAGATERLKKYKNGKRYQYCENDLSADIFDPIGRQGLTVDEAPYLPVVGLYDGSAGRFVVDPTVPTGAPGRNLPAIGVPYHSHWFDLDQTDSAPPWTPRRADWAKIVLPGSEPDPEYPAGTPTGAAGQPIRDAIKASRDRALSAINATALSPELEAFATKEIPTALWEVKTGCAASLKAAGVKAAADYKGADRPAWMGTDAGPKVKADALVYVSSPGETLYRHICYNCHGPRADGHGLQADALAAFSEGNTRPANFREGLFGPSGSPLSNVMAAFKLPGSKVMPLDLGAHYMAYMGLGGTNVLIPEIVIRQIQASTVFGVSRVGLDDIGGGSAGANMLQLARSLCTLFIPKIFAADAKDDGPTFDGRTFPLRFAFEKTSPGLPPFTGTAPDKAWPPFSDPKFPLIFSNGDAEMWRHICMDFSPWLIRVYEIVEQTTGTDLGTKSTFPANLTAIYRAGDPFSAMPSKDLPYPVERASLYDHTMAVVNTADPKKNFYAACLKGPRRPEVPSDSPLGRMPVCDDAFLANTSQRLWSSEMTTEEAEAAFDSWAARGAAVAGFSVFSYLKNGGAQKGVRPYYNECQSVK